MKNFLETNIEILDMEEMNIVFGGDDTKTNDGDDGDVIIWE